MTLPATIPMRGAAGAKARAQARKRSASVLADAPVPASKEVAPLRFADHAAATIHVSAEPIFVRDSGETYDDHGPLAFYSEHGNTGNDRAAMRTQLVEAHEWGGDCARVSVLLADGRSFILEGSWAAIRRAVPDRETVQAWKDAGATEFPFWDFTQADGPRRVEWVPIDRVPEVVQMEYESRGLKLEPPTGAIAPEPSAKDVARAQVGEFDLRAELAAANYKGVFL